MRKYILMLSSLILFIIMSTDAFPVPFEEKNPRDEKNILVPKGARPVLKEEFPRGQLVVDRIKARHRYELSIPFARAWNTAAITVVTGIQENPDLWNNRESGFAIHNQRLRIGAVKNKEYFQKETAGFPEGKYWPMPLLDSIYRSTGYLSSTFIHLAFKQIRNTYTGIVNNENVDYIESSDRLGGIINAMIRQNQNLNLMAQRNSHTFQSVLPLIGVTRTDNATEQTQIRNTAGISYKIPGESGNKLELSGNSIWSTLTDANQNDFSYVSGTVFSELERKLRDGLNVNFKTRLKIQNLTDQTVRGNSETIETRESVLLDVSNIATPASFAKLTLNAAGLYDSKYKAYVIPNVEIVLGPKAFQLGAGYRRNVLLPDYDDLYSEAKSAIVNNSLKPEDFWEAYGLLNINVITRIKLNATASYSRPESRMTWVQLFDHVWEPLNIKTSEAIVGEASLELNLIKSFNIFGSYKYQRFDNQLFEPENMANAGIYLGRPLSGTITIGGCFWNYQPTPFNRESLDPSSIKVDSPKEDIIFVYLRLSKSFYRMVNLFIDGRYTLDREDVIYYRGIPQAGRIISVGANIVFGGLD